MRDLESLEAVYYAGPYPEWLSLTTPVFDRLHLPGVRMPRDFDQVEIYKELQRLGGIPSLTMEDIQMQRAIEFALHRHHLVRKEPERVPNGVSRGTLQVG